MTLSDMEVEATLRRELHAVADRVPPAPRDLAVLTRQRHRALRRREIGVAGALLAAVLVFVGVPVIAGTLADGDRGQVAHPSPTTGVTGARGLYDSPTRGSLAGDEAWLQGMADRPWTGFVDEHRDPGMQIAPAPVDTHRVAYADDVPSGRVALVLGISGQEVVHSWWVGPAGAAPDEMTLAAYPVLYGRDVLALVDGEPDADELTLVVVADPGDFVQRDQVPTVDSQGIVVQGSEVLSLTDGIAVVPVDRRWAQAQPTVYVREDVALNGTVVSQSPRAQLDAAHRVIPVDPRGQAANLDVRTWLTADVGPLLRRYGLAEAEARPTLLATGPISETASAVLVGMTFPSGATGLWVRTYDSDSTRTTASTIELPFQRAGVDLLDQVIAVRAMAGFLVSAPSGTRADVLDGDGAVLGSIRLTNGAGGGTLPQPFDARSVRVVDAAGNVVGEAQVQDAG